MKITGCINHFHRSNRCLISAPPLIRTRISSAERTVTRSTICRTAFSFHSVIVGAAFSFFCLLHAGAGAVSIGAALQDSFLLFFECSLLGQDFCELCVADFFIFCINGFCQRLSMSARLMV